jgi:hypothetical protein
MSNNKLFTNLITGTAIVASLTTGGMAGLKVLASRNVEVEVPELTVASPSPSAVGTPAPTALPQPVESAIPSADPSATPPVMPSASPISSDFPIASLAPGVGFDDDDDDRENELEHEDKKVNENHDEDEREDHEDD